MVAGIAFIALSQVKPSGAAAAFFANAETKKIVSAARAAYSKMKTARFTITAGKDIKRYSFATGKMSSAQGGLQWTFSSRRLTVMKDNKLYRGVVSAPNVNGWLIRAGSPPERLPIELLNGRNPIDILLAPGSRVRKVGTMNLGNVNTDLVEIKSPGLRVSLGIRSDNHLIVDISAENTDKRGNVLFRSSRSVSWTSVNKPLPSSAFTLGTGKAPLPLKTLR